MFLLRKDIELCGKQMSIKKVEKTLIKVIYSASAFLERFCCIFFKGCLNYLHQRRLYRCELSNRNDKFAQSPN